MAPLYLCSSLFVWSAVLFYVGDGQCVGESCPFPATDGSCICKQTCSNPECNQVLGATDRIEAKLENMTSSVEGTLDAIQVTVETTKKGVEELNTWLPTDDLKDWLEEKLNNMTLYLDNIQRTVDNLVENECCCNAQEKFRFKVYTEELSRADASAFCKNLEPGAHLVVLDTAEKLQLVETHLKSQDSPDNRQHWVGGLQQENEGQWFWETGQEITNFWAPGEPNDFDGWEDCVTLAAHPTRPGWLLNDVPCVMVYPFICEY